MSAIVQVEVDVEKAIQELLGDCAGHLVDTRIFPLTRGNCDVYPALTYMRVSTTPYTTHDSAGGLNWARFQIDVYAKTYFSMVETSNVLLGCFRGFNGVVGDVRLNTTLMNMQDSYSGDTSIYRMRQDYRVHYQETKAF